ncbi:hypothetical protein DPEC_G00050560 [Dallia pectoralis]|uniref:Uncharacterized protein n=1 Tax=Dallia pectoralis TaxID=75939 RepID=A0ACC2HBR9_DALPE|nr:hypothetical protein DPEC_G00050560 [Dallia pectoralis]
MRDIFVIEVICLLAVSATWGRDTVSRSEEAREGQNISLMCSNNTWNEMLYIIWKINIAGSACKVAFSNVNDVDTCNDGKKVLNTTRGETYLHIPEFSVRDEGVYQCQSAYNGGENNQDITVTIIAPPKVSSWLEWNAGSKRAVCLAEGGKPAPSISWRNTWNTSISPKNTSDPNQVKSVLVLPEDFNAENLTCAVTHPYWTHAHISTPKVHKDHLVSPDLSVPIISTVTILTCVIIMATLGGLYFKLKQRCKLRLATPADSKAQQPQDCAEEVEPYASYVQRVNSIYNSSADLFT